MPEFICVVGLNKPIVFDTDIPEGYQDRFRLDVPQGEKNHEGDVKGVLEGDPLRNAIDILDKQVKLWKIECYMK